MLLSAESDWQMLRQGHANVDAVEARDRKALVHSLRLMPSSQVASGSQPPSVEVVHEGYNGGPSDTSLLPSFGQHIAAKIWNGEVRISF